MTDRLITGQILKQTLEAWAKDSVYIKHGQIIDLSKPGSLEAVEDAMRESLRAEMRNRLGIEGIGIHIKHTDDRVVFDRDIGAVVKRDYLEVTMHHDGMTVNVILGWEGQTGFDIDGDGA